MELDEFKQQWRELDRKLDRSIALNLRLLTEKRTRWTKLRLVPMLLLQPVQMVIGLALAVFFARFWIANLGAWPLVISGVFLHALSVGLIIDAVVRTVLIVRINYAAPVVTIQRYLALMRRWEIRSFKWAWVAIWLAPPALLMVGVKLVDHTQPVERCPQRRHLHGDRQRGRRGSVVPLRPLGTAQPADWAPPWTTCTWVTASPARRRRSTRSTNSRGSRGASLLHSRGDPPEESVGHRLAGLEQRLDVAEDPVPSAATLVAEVALGGARSIIGAPAVSCVMVRRQKPPAVCSISNEMRVKPSFLCSSLNRKR